MESVAKESDKIILVMMGLPARGKTYLANKIRRYCSWLGFNAKSFNTAEYRRNMFGLQDLTLQEKEQRIMVVKSALDDLFEFLVEKDGQIGIFDGTNVTKERQELVLSYIAKYTETCCDKIRFKLIWIESILDDPQLLQKHIQDTQIFSPDYNLLEPAKVVDDLSLRIRTFQENYHSIEGDEQSFIKVYDIGRRVIVNRVDGYIQGKIVFFIMNLRISDHPLFFSRHGESLYNVEGRIGGDSNLSEKGKEYAQRLNVFMKSQPEINSGLKLWSSTLKRTIETASYIQGFQPVHWRALSEIEVGVCDGMTYLQVQEAYPDEFNARATDKLRYRYPRGESYLDLTQRLEPVIFALEKATSPILVIAHRAIIRCLYAYFVDLPAEDVPHISVPLHTVVRITPRAYGTDVESYELQVSSVDEASDHKLT